MKTTKLLIATFIIGFSAFAHGEIKDCQRKATQKTFSEGWLRMQVLQVPEGSCKLLTHVSSIKECAEKADELHQHCYEVTTGMHNSKLSGIGDFTNDCWGCD